MAGIGGTGGLANEAFRAALRAQQESARKLGMGHAPVGGAAGGAGLQPVTPNPTAPTAVGATQAGGVDFAAKLQEGLGEVTQSVQNTEAMPAAMLEGQVGEFHEVALALKQSDLSFRFALQVRNKLIDAYREVMRMSV